MKWISIKEKLPLRGELVLTIDTKREILLCYCFKSYRNGGGNVISISNKKGTVILKPKDSCTNCEREITHWMSFQNYPED